FSGGTSGLSIGHISPEAAAGGELSLVRNNDVIEINIKQRIINVKLTDEEISDRLNKEEKKGTMAFKPKNRDRHISAALKAYAQMVTSANKGAVREI
ncbi:MAG: dihydroxy-acid dehydratase, partial [Bacteroidetes bacterium]|nr:dihydroxy-acid dehydratase [Bacteroidota bacterium]